MLDSSWKEKADKEYCSTYSPATGANAYLDGAADFQSGAIKELESHYKKIELIDDEFDTQKMKAYLQAVTNAIKFLKTLKAK